MREILILSKFMVANSLRIYNVIIMLYQTADIYIFWEIYDNFTDSRYDL